MKKLIWTCKIGELDVTKLPHTSDYPMRQAISKAYTRLTQEEPFFIFSGWGGELNPYERAVADNTEFPDPEPKNPPIIVISSDMKWKYIANWDETLQAYVTQLPFQPTGDRVHF